MGHTISLACLRVRLMKFFCTKCSFESNSFWKAVFHDVIHLYCVRKGERCNSIDGFPDRNKNRCFLKMGHSGKHVYGQYEWIHKNWANLAHLLDKYG